MPGRREEPPASASDQALVAWLGRLQEESFSRASRALSGAYPQGRRMSGAQLATYLARPAETLTAVPEDVRRITELRNRDVSLDWATVWVRMSPQRLVSFAEHGWPGN